MREVDAHDLLTKRKPVLLLQPEDESNRQKTQLETFETATQVAERMIANRRFPQSV